MLTEDVLDDHRYVRALVMANRSVERKPVPTGRAALTNEPGAVFSYNLPRQNLSRLSEALRYYYR